VIASSAIPSLESPAGVHILEPLDVENPRAAMLAFLGDDYADQRREETLDVDLPSWQLFAEEVLQWHGQAQT
jgi:hypothetical protein